MTILGALAQTSLVPRGQGLGRVVEGLWRSATLKRALGFGGASACAAALALALFLHAGPSSHVPSSDKAHPALPSVDAQTGGMVQDGDVTVSVPAGALGMISGLVTISVEHLVGDVPRPDGAPYMMAGGTAIHLALRDSAGNQLLTTEVPITVRINYGDADIQAAGGDAGLLAGGYLVQPDTAPIANPLRFPAGTWVFFPASLMSVNAEAQVISIRTQAIPPVIAVVVRPFMRARITTSETGLYSGPGKDAYLFGNRPQLTSLQVVGPLIEGRLLVLDPETENYAYVDALDVAPEPAASAL
jgi:hypothetical protein